MDFTYYNPDAVGRFKEKRSGIKMDLDPRCKGPVCGGKGQLLGRRLTRPWEIECVRCHFVNVRD